MTFKSKSEFEFEPPAQSTSAEVAAGLLQALQATVFLDLFTASPLSAKV